jgi:hypothetical protein
LPRPRADRNPIGDRVADQVIHRARFFVGPQPRPLNVALEARQALRIAHELFRQQPQRDFAPEARITRAIHLAHAAGPEQFQNFEAAKPRSGAGIDQSRRVVGLRLYREPVPAVDQGLETGGIFWVILSRDGWPLMPTTVMSSGEPSAHTSGMGHPGKIEPQY